MKTQILLNIAILLFTLHSCHAQPERSVPAKNDRKPAVAGKFYPDNTDELTKVLKSYFSKPSELAVEGPLAIIVPHAGYVFSGSTAAAGYRQIDRNKKFKHIFLIGSSHTMYFNGASIYCAGDFITPLGKVAVDTLSQWLVEEHHFINDDIKPHATEHSLEVQLPFLQYWLNNSFTIVPVIIGGQSEETCRKLANALKPFFNEDNLFVISTDFSHYPDYDNARISDSRMANAILTNSSKEFLHDKNLLENSGIDNLATPMCGWTSVLTLLNITEGMHGIEYIKIQYTNSGDSDYGDKQQVVGYYALCAVKNTPNDNTSDFFLEEKEKIELLRIARKTLDTYLTNNELPEYNKRKLTGNMMASAGAFVTLTKNKHLRGCIGNFVSEQPLYLTVQDMAVAAATHDPRFAPVNVQELSGLEIEISVLTPLRKISSADEFELGKHGIYIRKGNRSGTFLPQVANETNWTKEEFLGHCSRDKAQIGWDGWKTAELYVYEALVFSEHEFKDQL